MGLVYIMLQRNIAFEAQLLLIYLQFCCTVTIIITGEMLTTDRFGSSATLTNSGPKKAWKKDEKTKLCYTILA